MGKTWFTLQKVPKTRCHVKELPKHDNDFLELFAVQITKRAVTHSCTPIWALSLTPAGRGGRARGGKARGGKNVCVTAKNDNDLRELLGNKYSLDFGWGKANSESNAPIVHQLCTCDGKLTCDEAIVVFLQCELLKGQLHTHALYSGPSLSLP